MCKTPGSDCGFKQSGINDNLPSDSPQNVGLISKPTIIRPISNNILVGQSRIILQGTLIELGGNTLPPKIGDVICPCGHDSEGNCLDCDGGGTGGSGSGSGSSGGGSGSGGGGWPGGGGVGPGPGGGNTGGGGSSNKGGGATGGSSGSGHYDNPHDYSNDVYDKARKLNDLISLASKNGSPELRKKLDRLNPLINLILDFSFHHRDLWQKALDMLDALTQLVNILEAYDKIPSFLKWAVEAAEFMSVALTLIPLLIDLWDSNNLQDVLKAIADFIPIPYLWEMIKFFYKIGRMIGDKTEYEWYRFLRDNGYPALQY